MGNQSISSHEIRDRFLTFFAERGHTVVDSAPLVPDDPTLLFTNAGMVPFKDTFLGLEERAYTRAASSQKCMRVSGKHNDLENVGPSPRHHTFFEMLGNFSFGDYFKQDAIRYAWAFLVDELEVDAERLIITVFLDDDEAHGLWRDEIGVPEDRILRMGEATNFWMMADVGPCGPTSEIHYDFGPDACSCGRDDCSVLLDNDCTRWLEIWNLVFMQSDQSADGTRTPLPQTGVDTGMGLERITSVLQDAAANYETDLFQPIMERVQRLLEHDDAERAVHEVGYRVLADHSRAMTFLIADGVLPGNDGRRYVLRLIMRRAMRFGRLIGFEGPFLPELVDEVVQVMSAPYPELAERAEWIREVVAEEEARFARTLAAGLEILDEVIGRTRTEERDVIPGTEVFRLYDTYGFPPDLTRIVAEEHDMTIDRVGFERAMEEQRERARAGGTFGTDASREHYRSLDLPSTEFLGYDAMDAEAEVLALVVDGAAAEAASAGDDVEIVLDRTPFYGESGGQVGDRGRVLDDGLEVRIEDAHRPLAGVIVHVGTVEEGTVRVGQRVRAEVDTQRRADIMRNHTATHLLHHALQDVIGDHAQQRGSLVAPDRLRFDFAHLKALEESELEEIERRVNRMIRDDAPVAASEMDIDRARRLGATMLFGEKYGDRVRVVEIEEISRELCGGTHLDRTGQIGLFMITGESSVGSGLRRIEALTGRVAEEEVRSRRRLLHRLAERVGAQSLEQIDDRIEALQSRLRDDERALEQARAQLAVQRAADLADDAVDVAGIPVVAAVVEAADADALRNQLDAVRDRLADGVVVLGAVVDDKPRLVAAVSDAIVSRGVHAGLLVKELAGRLGGGGGGRPTMAEAGGRDSSSLADVVRAAPGIVEDQLAGSDA